jgi:hypothetical protein
MIKVFLRNDGVVFPYSDEVYLYNPSLKVISGATMEQVMAIAEAMIDSQHQDDQERASIKITMESDVEMDKAPVEFDAPPKRAARGSRNAS